MTKRVESETEMETQISSPPTFTDLLLEKLLTKRQKSRRNPFVCVIFSEAIKNTRCPSPSPHCGSLLYLVVFLSLNFALYYKMIKTALCKQRSLCSAQKDPLLVRSKHQGKEGSITSFQKKPNSNVAQCAPDTMAGSVGRTNHGSISCSLLFRLLIHTATISDG